MLSVAADHARLELQKDELFTGVTESVRSLLQVCRLNALPAALIVSYQNGFDFRSSLRVALRFAAARPAPLPPLRLALVAPAAADGVLQSVVEVAAGIGITCKAFRDEAGAMAWLASPPGSRR